MSLLSQSRETLRREWAALLLIGIAVAIQLCLIAQPVEFLVTNILPDDAFYYFEVARNIAAGNGPTFDGLTPTNGYHPLWMVILVPIFSFFGTAVGALEPIRVALALAIICNVVTAIALYRILAHVVAERSSRLLGLGLFLYNPYFLYESLNGLETALALMVTALFLLRVLSLPVSPSRRYVVGLGVLGGCMVLARIDLVFYLAAMLVWLWISRGFRSAVVVGAVATGLVIPFFLWNALNFGMVLTSASGANTLVNRVLIEQDHGWSAGQAVKATVYNLHLQTNELMRHTGSAELAYALVGAGILAVLLGVWRVPVRRTDITPVQAFGVGFLLLFIANVGIRWTARTWYFVSFGIIVALLGAALVELVLRSDALSSSTKRIVGSSFLLLICFLFFTSWHQDLRERIPKQREMYAAAQWFNEQVPDTTRIGVFNAGVIGYFANAQVINLDGLVNTDAYRAMQGRRLWVYIRESEIEYLSDFDVYFDYRYRSFLGEPGYRAHLRLVTAIPSNASTTPSAIKIYSIVDAGAPRFSR